MMARHEPSHGTDGGGGREGPYRFTVRCDRLTNGRIETAAKKAGVSATTFVQRHFETILDVAVAAAEPARFDAASFNPLAFSRAHHITVSAAHCWRALRQRADATGEVTASYYDLGQALNASDDIVRKHVLSLIEADLIVRIGGGGNGGSRYRVKG